ncbi:hypothetical protein ACA910_012131 [Epithemia clementina (nom. ined.)]
MKPQSPLFISLVLAGVCFIPSSIGYAPIITGPGLRVLPSSTSTTSPPTLLLLPQDKRQLYGSSPSPCSSSGAPRNSPTCSSRRQQRLPGPLYQSDLVMSTNMVDDLDASSSRRSASTTATVATRRASPSASSSSSSRQHAALSWKSRIFKFMGINTDNSSSSEDGMTLRQRLTKTGVYAAMSYNVVSQINSGSSTSIAWFFYSMRTGLSPLAPGQWKGFLTFYAGFWVANNVLRPLRVALALAMAPKMERLSEMVQNRTQLTKTKAVTLTFIVTYMTALAFSATCLTMASVCSGVPVFPPSSSQ